MNCFHDDHVAQVEALKGAMVRWSSDDWSWICRDAISISMLCPLALATKQELANYQMASHRDVVRASLHCKSHAWLQHPIAEAGDWNKATHLSLKALHLLTPVDPSTIDYMPSSKSFWCFGRWHFHFQTGFMG